MEFPEVGKFEIDKSSIIRLENPPSRLYSDRTDVELFQLVEDPGLPPLRLATEVPDVGTPVVAIGRGLDRETEQTYWNARGRNWSETDPPGDFSGFKTANMGSTLRWGTNLLEEDELFETERDDNITTVVESLTNHDVHVLITEFDYDDGNTDTSVTHDGDFMTPYESQACAERLRRSFVLQEWRHLGIARNGRCGRTRRRRNSQTQNQLAPPSSEI